MYRDTYAPIEGLPLTTTIPLLLKWKGESLYEVEQKNPAIKQATVHRICTGETENPKRPGLERLAGYFGIKYEEIYDVEFVKAYVDADGEMASDSAFQALLSIASKMTDSELAILIATGRTIIETRA